MTIEQELQEAPGDDEVGSWSGEPILLPEGGHPDNRLQGTLLSKPFFPGLHVHPAVRAVAEKEQAGHARRSQLQADYESRLAERPQVELRDADDDDSDELTRFDAKTEKTKIRIRLADQVIREAREELEATKNAVADEWNEHLHEAAKAPQEAAQDALRVLREALGELSG